MITQLTEKQICEKYKKGQSIHSLHKESNISFYLIKRILIKNSIYIRNCLESRHRKYSYDKTFFEKINTEHKAYWLGFLYADGCVAEHSVNLSISQIDIDILEKFKKDIKFTGPIELRNDIIDYGPKYGRKESHMCKIRINSMELKKQLIALGCMERKTFKLKFPNNNIVPNHLIHHFIRGYFDGDGSIWERKYKTKKNKKTGYARITSTYNMVKSIKKIFLNKFNNINNSSVVIDPHPESKGIAMISFLSFKAMGCLRDFLYFESNRYMDRKRDKFFEFDFSPHISRQKIIKDKIKELFKDGGVFSILELTKKFNETYAAVRFAIIDMIKEGNVSFLKRRNLDKIYQLNKS